MKQTKTGKRVDYINAHRAEIDAALLAPVADNQLGGSNAAGLPGWSRGGWAWWLRALTAAGIGCPRKNYWSGCLPTPSTAIPAAVAEVLRSAPPEIA